MCRCRATHWKQTVFYLEDMLTVERGEVVEGRVVCAPNAKNPRDLDIEIEYRLEGKNGAWANKQEYRLR